MREKLADIIRRIVSGSALMTGVSSQLDAMPPIPTSLEPLTPAPDASVGSASTEMVLRAARPRLILRPAAPSLVELVSSHRSHRSHSSHRSHYSSSGAPSRPSTRPETTVRVRKEPTATTVAPTFGSRILVLGMKGADVMELMRLLVAHQYLKAPEISRDSTFTKDVENAVKMFQIAVGVADDGKVGPTLALLLKRRP